MRIGGLAALFVLVSATPAAAEGDLYDRLWPRVPEGRNLKLSDQITDQLTELGNFMGEHMTVLSHDVLSLDARLTWDIDTRFDFSADDFSEGEHVTTAGDR